MSNQFLSPEGDLENYFVTEYWLIDQYIGDELWMWGSNSGGYAGALGINNSNDTLTPVTTFSGGTDWKQISCSLGFSAAIKTDGTLWTWGGGGSGQLGTNDTTTRLTPVTTFAGGNDWKQVATSGNTTLAIKTDGTLWTCGNSEVTGTFGEESGFGPNRLTPVTTVLGGNDWKTVAAGFFHALAIKTDGTLWTWGDNSRGQLGKEENNIRSISTPITTFAGGTNWADILSTDLSTIGSGGDYSSATAAIKTDGTLWTWGYGFYGQLGTNDETNRSTPVTTFAGGTDWKHLSVGLFHMAAIKTDGTLWTWGSVTDGGLGTNDNDNNRSTPVTTFAGGTNWKQVSAGESITTAIKTDGTLWTWGGNFNGQLGTNDQTNRSTPVTTFAGGTNWKEVNCFENHTVAIKTDGTLWTWGLNNQNQLGINEIVNQKLTPVTTFAGGTNWKQASCNFNTTAAIKTDGTLWTWGSNFDGILGTNDETNRSTPVTTFAGGTNWSKVSCGYDHIAAIKTDGTLWTWGTGSNGKLGTNNTNNSLTPVTTFAGGTDWKQVGAGYNTTIAVTNDGKLYVWGNSTPGAKLGNASSGIALTPVTTFAGGTNWSGAVSDTQPEDLYTLSAGDAHTAAIKTDGTLWTWGAGADGQLGINRTSFFNTIPVTTFSGGTNWKQVSGGTSHTAAIKTDGTLWTWGLGTNGRLGTNDLTQRSTPVTTFTGGTDWKQVSSGGTHTSAIKTDGTLWAWGNRLQIGIPSSSSSSLTPITTSIGGNNWADTATTQPEDLYTLSAGTQYTAAIKTDGTLWTWGIGSSGQLGNGSTASVLFPNQTFAGGTDWKQVSSGGYHTAAIKTDGTLWTWGNGNSGRLGNAQLTNRSTPVTTFTGGTDWKQVSSGILHTAAIKTDGTLWTWGNGTNGQLGTNDLITQRSTPVTTFTGGTDWKQVSSGGFHTAAIKTDGTLWTWGAGGSGRLGNAQLTTRSTPVTTFAGGTDWKQVSSGRDHTAAIKTDGTLWTWGIGTNGRLGTNDLTQRSTPVTTFTGGTDWKQVSSGGTHTAAIKTDGTLWTWGNGNSGRLGNAVLLENTRTPVTTFAGGTNWADTATTEPEDLYTLSAGTSHTAAIKTDGTLWTWGLGTNGRLGTNDLTQRSTPVTTFTGGTDWKQVSSGGTHTSAIKTDGTLWAWGSGFNGRLGNAVITGNISTPVTTFAGGTDWKQVSSSSSHTAAIKTDGTLWTWGNGGNGQLGTNDTTQRSTPVTTFAGGTDWKQVSSGGLHTAAIKTDGTLWTWGNGTNGRLGTNDFTNRSTPVTTFAGGTDWKQVSSGGFHTAAIKTDGTLWTWGNGGSGRLGNAQLTDRSTPVTTFAGGTDWKQVSSGDQHTAAIKTDGTLWTWGIGTNGRLGTNDFTNRSTPVTTFAGGTDWKQVSSGNDHTVALRDDGVNKELFAWGNANFGQLGNNFLTSIHTPVTTFAGGTDWKQVSAGNAHTVALRDDGVNKELFTWGNGTFGELGNDINTNIPNVLEETNWKQVSSGTSHTAAIKTDGTLWTWGFGSNGRLGTSDSTTRSTPVTTFAGGTDWKQVSAGGTHTAAIKTDGTLWTWGLGTNGRLGTNDLTQRSTPVTTFTGGTDWKQVSAGSVHTAAIKTDGTLWTWGFGGNGRLGTNNTSQRNTPVTTFAGGTDWKQVSSGGAHTVALRDDGVNKELFTWGYANSGQLGNNNNTFFDYVPSKVGSANNWKQASGGRLHSAAVKTDGTLWTWGFNGFGPDGQLGNNDIDIGETFTPITTFAGGTDWKQVACGANHVAAIKTNGTLWAWGNNIYGQLGNGNLRNDRKTPITTFAGGTNWADTSTTQPEDLYTLSAGTQYTAAIKTDGTLWTWGSGSNGQLGTNDFTTRSTPVTTFTGGTDWKQVSSGRDHTAAIKTDGTLWTWGTGSNGRLGNAVITGSISTPVTTFAGGTDWKQVSSGRDHTAAIKTDGTLWTWGNGINGQLGTNDTGQRSTPVTTFAGGTDWKQVSSGGVFGTHTAAIKTDGTLWTWGGGGSGQLGTNDTTPNRSTPVTTFAGGTDWKQVSSGSSHTAAIKTDGTLWTWGAGFSGQLGTNDAGQRSTPVTTFAGGTDWKQLSSGRTHTAAIKTDGTLWTWGSQYFGQLGNDVYSFDDVLTPVTTFAGGTDWKQVSSGDDHTVALRDDGVNKELILFGDNASGQLGLASIPNYAPGKVGSATNWKQVSGGYGATAAVKTDGTLWTWGYNTDGHLGINADPSYATRRATPVTTFAGGNNWRQVSIKRIHMGAVKTGISPDLPLS